MSPQSQAGITNSLWFLKSLDIYKTEKPYVVYFAPESTENGARRSNLETEEVEGIWIEDIKGRRENFTLDECGFAAITHDMKFNNFEDDAKIESEYRRQVEEVIRRQIPDAEEVFVFDWRIRRERVSGDEETLLAPIDVMRNSFPLLPSKAAHNDITEATALKRVRRHLPHLANQIGEKRLRVLNFWRPINHDVHNWPLVLCDGRTTPFEDLIAADQVSRRFSGDIYYSKYNPKNKWYYESDQTKKDGFLFKSWDTKADAPSRYCFHTSMDMDTVAREHPPRESIEARALVISA